jgi:DNA (cytosine-5)-methyltransferase 1
MSAIAMTADRPKGADLFSGFGGFTQGATEAGVDVVWAANHWPPAVHYHSVNHPTTVHACQDLQQANWSDVPAHDILLASSACQGHTHARGKERPHHDSQRSTAWAIVSAVEHHRPWGGLAENVPEFLNWALYPAWCAALNALGYAVTPYMLDAADHGVPQHRVRVFVLFTRTKHPLELQLPRREHVGIGRFIRWEHGNWSRIDRPGRAAATLRRVRAGRACHGDRFIMPYYGSGSGLTGRSLDRPIGTITTRDRWALVNGDYMRMLSKEEARSAMGFPDGYLLPDAHHQAMHMLGNAVCPPVATDVIAAMLRERAAA